MFWAEIWKLSFFFLIWKVSFVLVVKCSGYLNRLVFVMSRGSWSRGKVSSFLLFRKCYYIMLTYRDYKKSCTFSGHFRKRVLQREVTASGEVETVVFSLDKDQDHYITTNRNKQLELNVRILYYHIIIGLGVWFVHSVPTVIEWPKT